MPNVRKTQLQVVRTRLWAARVVDELGITDCKQVELFISSCIGHEIEEPSGVFRHYLTGRTMPSSKIGPAVNGPWLERVDFVLPGTSDWFRSPMWFLLEDRCPKYNELLGCVKLLPRELQRDLLHTSNQHLPAQYQFREITESQVLHVMHGDAPWHLGALACVYRMADLKGHKLVARRALLSFVQAIEVRHSLVAESLFKNVFQEFKGLVGEHALKYLVSMSGATSHIDLNEHLQEHREFEWLDTKKRAAVHRWLGNLLAMPEGRQ